MDNVDPVAQASVSKPLFNRKVIIGLIVVTSICSIILFLFAMFPFKNKLVANLKNEPTPTPKLTSKKISEEFLIQPGKTKLSDTKHAPFAHKIFPGSISPKDKESLKGYAITYAPAADGTTALKIVYEISGFGPIELNIKPGEQVFFVIPEPVKDVGDSFVVVTDMAGNIIER